MTEQPNPAPAWERPKEQAEVERLLDDLGMPECVMCGAIVERIDLRPAVCWPCQTQQRSRANWYAAPTRPQRYGEAQDAASPPNPAAMDWQAQCERYAADMAVLNARCVRLRGLVVRALPYLPVDVRADVEATLERP